MALGYRGKRWARVKAEAQADAQRLGHPVYIYGDSVGGFYSEYADPSAHRAPTAIFFPARSDDKGE